MSPFSPAPGSFGRWASQNQTRVVERTNLPILVRSNLQWIFRRGNGEGLWVIVLAPEAPRGWRHRRSNAGSARLWCGVPVRCADVGSRWGRVHRLRFSGRCAHSRDKATTGIAGRDAAQKRPSFLAVFHEASGVVFISRWISLAL